jgi:hypothetical protein
MDQAIVTINEITTEPTVIQSKIEGTGLSQFPKYKKGKYSNVAKKDNITLGINM